MNSRENSNAYAIFYLSFMKHPNWLRLKANCSDHTSYVYTNILTGGSVSALLTKNSKTN